MSHVSGLPQPQVLHQTARRIVRYGYSLAAFQTVDLRKQAVWPPGSADTVCTRPPSTQTSVRLTLKNRYNGMRVASKVGNLLSKFGHARPLGSRIIRYVRDGRTDRRTDKSNAYCPLPTGGGIIMYRSSMCTIQSQFGCL